MDTERHPLAPFLPEDAKILMLGSFPPPRVRWSMDFYYPNFQNDMWRIIGMVFYGDKAHFVDGKKFNRPLIEQFCRDRGIALSDTAHSIIRLNGNASDKFLEVVQPADIASMLARIPLCHAVAVTGQKAIETFRSSFEVAEPAVSSRCEFQFADRTMHLYRMPSSSRAYPKPLDEKAAIYEKMFREAGVL